MWWRRFDIDAVNESQILRSLVVTTRRLFIWVVFFTSSIFSSLTDIDMSLIFFVDRLWLLGEMLSHEWKLCTMTFLITQRSNIVWTASNWDLLTLLTSIRTQNRIKRFIVDITYRWISLPVVLRNSKLELIDDIKKKERDKQSDWNIFISKSERRDVVLDISSHSARSLKRQVLGEPLGYFVLYEYEYSKFLYLCTRQEIRFAPKHHTPKPYPPTNDVAWG